MLSNPSRALCPRLCAQICIAPFNPLHRLSQGHDRYPHFTGGAPEARKSTATCPRPHSQDSSLPSLHTAPPWTTEPLTITASAKKEGTRPGDAELRPGPLDIGPRLGPGTRGGLSPHGHCRPDGCKGGFHASAVGLRLHSCRCPGPQFPTPQSLKGERVPLGGQESKIQASRTSASSSVTWR